MTSEKSHLRLSVSEGSAPEQQIFPSTTSCVCSSCSSLLAVAAEWQHGKNGETVLYWQHTCTCRRPIYWQQQQVLRRAKHPLKWQQARQRLEALVQVPPMPALPARLRWSALIRGRNWVERRASRIFDKISSETETDMKPLFNCLRSFLYSTVCINM